ncbi:UBE2E [Mytilus edulis]|uniref:UBE2E n=1 Tax=Mytilus edulis TaxID=6550 RepID=A0A8S3U9B1_MYTED|nr:UBE2E [Mytilus edulis]
MHSTGMPCKWLKQIKASDINVQAGENQSVPIPSVDRGCRGQESELKTVFFIGFFLFLLLHIVTLTTQDIRRKTMSSGSTGRGRGRRSRGGHEETNGGPSTSSGAAPVPETPLPVPSATKSSSTKSIKPTGTSLKRIQKELAEITLDPPPNCR